MVTRNELKKEFQNGERPSGEDFAALIDSFLHKDDDGLQFDTSANKNLTLPGGLKLADSNSTEAGMLRLKDNRLQIYDGLVSQWMEVRSGFQPVGTTGAMAYAGGNVGIGNNFTPTQPPTYRLEVDLSNNTNPSQRVRFGSAVFHSGPDSEPGAYLSHFQYAADNKSYGFRQLPSGEVSINAPINQAVYLRQGSNDVRLAVTANDGHVIVGAKSDLVGGYQFQVSGSAFIQGKGLTLKGDQEQLAPYLTIHNSQTPNPSILTAREGHAFDFEYPVGTSRLSIHTTGNIGIGTTNPEAGLDVRSMLTASADNSRLTGLHIKPSFNDNGKADVQHYGLVVEEGDVDISGNLTVRGNLTTKKLVDQYIVRPNDMVLLDNPFTEFDRSQWKRRRVMDYFLNLDNPFTEFDRSQLISLGGYPALKFQEQGIAAGFSMLCPVRLKNDQIPTGSLRLYCTVDKAPPEGIEITWGIRWRWVRAVGPIASRFPFNEEGSIRRQRLDGNSDAEKLLSMVELHQFPDPEFSRKELLPMTLFGRNDERYLHVSNPFEITANIPSADYLVAYFELEKSHGLTVYLLMIELRI